MLNCQVRTSVIKAAASLPVTSLEGLQQSADTIASASMFTDETSTTAMVYCYLEILFIDLEKNS